MWFLSGQNNTIGFDNTFNGFSSGRNNTGGRHNTFSGSSSGFSNIGGILNTFIGFQSGANNITGHFNAFLGGQSGVFNTGSSNTFIGQGSGQFHISGDNNTFTGSNSGSNSAAGESNTFTGTASGAFNNDGSFNTFTGQQSGLLNTNGNFNTFNGYQSGFNNTGTNNTFTGNLSGFNNTSGNFNTYLGDMAGPSAGGFNNSAGIGAGTIVRASDRMILGNNINVGIGLSDDNVQFGPQRPLEIDFGTAGFNPSPNGAPGFSGLRFRDLHAGNTPVPNPSGNFLSVDALGDVILVAGGVGGAVTANNGCSIFPAGNVQWGNNIGLLTASLLNDREIPMNNNILVFTKPAGPQAFNQNNIGIGTSTPIARVHVVKDLSVANSFNTFPTGLLVQNTDISTGTPYIGTAYGVRSVMNADNRLNFGGHFLATSPNANTANIGVNGIGQNGSFNRGVQGLALGTDVLAQYTGGFFQSLGPVGTGTTQYGIFAAAPVEATSWAGWFQGNVNVNGTITANIYGPSDQQLKTNIDTITNATQIISQLTPRTFFWDTTNTYGFNFSSERQYGFVGQEVEPILPELVTEVIKPAVYDSLGNIVEPAFTYMVLNYNAFIALLMKGNQEQQAVIQNLSNQVNNLTAIVTNCCSQENSLQAPNGNNGNNSNSQISTLEVKLSNNDCVLTQNSPNPFVGSTSIGFYINKTIQLAQVGFYDALGQIIKIMDISQRGEGRINIDGEDLRSSMYSYSLIIDGKVCDTKRMIKE